MRSLEPLNTQLTHLLPEKESLAPCKLLQSCLSNSWGGLEMVAYEHAISFSKNNFECHTLCLENSPLEKHLRALKLPTVTVQNNRGLFNFFKIRNFIQSRGIKTVLVQLLKDLHLVSLSVMNQSDVKILAISHSFIGVSKKDFIHCWSYGRLQKLICLTDLHKQNLLQNLPLQTHQMEVVPNYVDCERFHPNQRSEALRKNLGGTSGAILIGIASRLDPKKGQDTALQAVALLKKKNVDVRLVIVGENTRNEMNYLEVLKKMTSDLDIQDQVLFTGYRENMGNIMASIDALLMPSHCETFGRVLIEAMASKTPVIATNAGGVPNIIDANINGLLVSPQNPQELASAMEQIATIPELRRSLAESGYFKVRSTYAKEVVEGRFLKLLST
jgi:glycosyltransferase involved in cell wall biosynthesis